MRQINKSLLIRLHPPHKIGAPYSGIPQKFRSPLLFLDLFPLLARRHEVPLSKQAIAVINELPRVGDRYAITLNGEKLLNNWKKDKDRLDELAAPRDDWTLHDLRRTAASGLTKLGVSLVVIEKVLNHVSGSLAGIVGVYQRHEFADEKRAALQQWANHVEGLVS